MMEIEVSVPREALISAPHINWKHIDGPLMTWAGNLHWLTLMERISLFFDIRSIEDVAEKHWPNRRVWRKVGMGYDGR
jgi:hypothetical protein